MPLVGQVPFDDAGLHVGHGLRLERLPIDARHLHEERRRLPLVALQVVPALQQQETPVRIIGRHGSARAGRRQEPGRSRVAGRHQQRAALESQPAFKVVNALRPLYHPSDVILFIRFASPSWMWIAVFIHSNAHHFTDTHSLRSRGTAFAC